MRSRAREGYVFRAHARDRFAVYQHGRRARGPGGFRFEERTRYYRCPACDKKTRIARASLEVFDPPTSVFDAETQARFGPPDLSGYRGVFDFFCRGCGRPRRILYETLERGMGGALAPCPSVVLEWCDADDEPPARG